MSRLLVFLVWAVLLPSCHDAPRNNPFDPALTPAVTLAVALDDTAGTATLTWTRYEGQQPFREYRVLRKVSGLERVDTLAILGQVEQTTWVDTSMTQHTPYGYRVSVVNTSGLEASTTPWETRPVQLPAVVLERVDFYSRTATAHLEWTPYRGGQFAKYEVRRNTAELASQVVFETPDPTATTFVDSNLVGATEYYYQVVVRTQRGEEVAGEQRSGAIHPRRPMRRGLPRTSLP